mmetsp:Transcript_14533/g.52273  ORF Transcript_14533/g.52273 Transcript_14533/m.52273 type:complete len:456 (+) Transcript_14533:398-1765(+)
MPAVSPRARRRDARVRRGREPRQGSVQARDGAERHGTLRGGDQDAEDARGARARGRRRGARAHGVRAPAGASLHGDVRGSGVAVRETSDVVPSLRGLRRPDQDRARGRRRARPRARDDARRGRGRAPVRLLAARGGAVGDGRRSGNGAHPRPRGRGVSKPGGPAPHSRAAREREGRPGDRAGAGHVSVPQAPAPRRRGGGELGGSEPGALRDAFEKRRDDVGDSKRKVRRRVPADVFREPLVRAERVQASDRAHDVHARGAGSGRGRGGVREVFRRDGAKVGAKRGREAVGVRVRVRAVRDGSHRRGEREPRDEGGGEGGGVRARDREEGPEEQEDGRRPGRRPRRRDRRGGGDGKDRGKGRRVAHRGLPRQVQGAARRHRARARGVEAHEGKVPRAGPEPARRARDVVRDGVRRHGAVADAGGVGERVRAAAVREHRALLHRVRAARGEGGAAG